MGFVEGKYILAPVGAGVYAVKVGNDTVHLNLKQLRRLNDLLREYEDREPRTAGSEDRGTQTG